MKTIVSSLAPVALAVSAFSVAHAKPSDADPNEVICKHQKRTDSRFSVKICRTRAQWAALTEQNKRDYAEVRDRPVIEIRPE